MVYYTAFRAVANMYRRIHLKYIQTGVQILNGLSTATTDALRNARHRELRQYNTTISKDLQKYIEDVEYTQSSFTAELMLTGL